MRQQFASLACLLKGVSASGKSARWDLSDIKLQGDYLHAWGDRTTSVSKQFVGEFTLNNGAQVRPLPQQLQELHICHDHAFIPLSPKQFLAMTLRLGLCGILH